GVRHPGTAPRADLLAAGRVSEEDSMATAEDIESLTSFRSRAREFALANLPRAEASPRRPLSMAEAKALQATIFDAGFAGIAVPREYGGAGLTLAHQEVWADEVQAYVVPNPLFVSIGMLGITLLDHG